MAGVFYNLFVSILSVILQIAFVGKGKLGLFVRGRRNLPAALRSKLENNTGPVIWIHCPSLGEFEQGRTVLDELRRRFPGHVLLLTFFSPSGYELRKQYANADIVSYLPFDTRGAVMEFVSVARPELVILVKYDFWPNLLFALEKQGVPVVAISSIFRSEQIYFKWYGSFFLRALKTIDRFFLQDVDSEKLLRNYGITEAEVTGDTRFDRVDQVVADAQPVHEVAAFVGEHECWVVGSAWPEDMEVIGSMIRANSHHRRVVIVPHEVDEKSLLAIENHCRARSIRLSQLSMAEHSADVLIIDRMGLLSRVYRYATYAWIGGAFGKGLHNILEAAAYGKPVFFGNRNYKKFREANALIAAGGAWAVADHEELHQHLQSIAPGSEGYIKACSVSGDYVRTNTGATEKIVSWCTKLLDS
ncbi:MAG: 3-deoxy-D-manno-octulosonic acid transferase [Bacteroidota bacterium]